jgi:hypothetical protein
LTTGCRSRRMLMQAAAVVVSYVLVLTSRPLLVHKHQQRIKEQQALLESLRLPFIRTARGLCNWSCCAVLCCAVLCCAVPAAGFCQGP